MQQFCHVACPISDESGTGMLLWGWCMRRLLKAMRAVKFVR